MIADETMVSADCCSAGDWIWFLDDNEDETARVLRVEMIKTNQVWSYASLIKTLSLMSSHRLTRKVEINRVLLAMVTL